MTSCEIIHDLLPLYHDNACSEESRALVEAHVRSCMACRAMLDDLGAPLPLPANSFLPPASRLKQAKNRLIRKTALAVTAIFCAIGIFAAGGAALYGAFEQERALPWEPSMLQQIEGEVYLEFSLKRYARAVCLFRRVTIDGEERDIAVLQLTQTWVRRYLDTSLEGPEEVAMGTGTGLYLGRGGQKHDIAYGAEYEPAEWDPRWTYPGSLAAVYYLDAPSPLDLKDVSAQEVLAALEQNGALLWAGES